MGGRVLVARIGAAHGLRGEVRLWSFTEDPMAVKDFALESEDGQAFTIEALRPARNFCVARLAGVADRTAAEALRNCKLYVARERLPQPEANEFYHADLIGLAAVATDGSALGTVLAIHNFGAGDVIQIKPERGPTLLVPFTDSVVPPSDLAARRLVVNPPDGAFDVRDAQPGE